MEYMGIIGIIWISQLEMLSRETWEQMTFFLLGLETTLTLPACRSNDIIAS